MKIVFPKEDPERTIHSRQLKEAGTIMFQLFAVT